MAADLPTSQPNPNPYPTAPKPYPGAPAPAPKAPPAVAPVVAAAPMAPQGTNAPGAPPERPPLPSGKRFGSKIYKEGQRGERRDGPPGGPDNNAPRSDLAKPFEVKPRADFGTFKPNKRDLDQSIEDEMSAALSGFDALPKLDAPEPKPVAAPTGSRKKGRIVSIHGKDVFVDVPGGRGQGVLPIQQFEGKPPTIGDEVEFEIERYDGANGLLVLTMDGAAQQVTDWSSVTYGMIVEAKVTDLNKTKSGMLIEVNGIRGFMPISQADMYRIEKPEDFVGQRLKVMVTEVSPEERNLIVSRRAVLEKEREQKAAQFWETLAEGQTHKGIVKSIKPFGAFVDLGGADGLIPVRELSWGRVGTPEEIVSIGQLVEVKVLRLEPDTRKIALSLRALASNPWSDFAQNHRPGSRATGSVTRLMDFGAFVELAPGIEGLIHISELSTGRVRRPQDAVQVGQQVEVQILQVDTEQQRIALSLKAVQAGVEAAEDAATQAEAETDKQEALERLANRVRNPNLRGGMGGGAIRFG
ncbi:MAG: 30S ribosomal protein S1 [Gemmataceae bacterium]